jgi:hypothetical protein
MTRASQTALVIGVVGLIAGLGLVSLRPTRLERDRWRFLLAQSWWCRSDRGEPSSLTSRLTASGWVTFAASVSLRHQRVAGRQHLTPSPDCQVAPCFTSRFVPE